MSEAIVVKGEGITLELLLHRKHGLRGRGLLNQAFELNPGIAGLGPILPMGTSVVIPDLPAETKPVVQRVTLFNR